MAPLGAIYLIVYQLVKLASPSLDMGESIQSCPLSDEIFAAKRKKKSLNC